MENEVQQAVLSALSYFHVFLYPLTKEEIWKFLPQSTSPESFDTALSELETAGIVYHINNFYSLDEHEWIVNRRIEGNKMSKKKLKKAMQISRFLGMFPFVEAVCISGSLSKDFAFKDSDLDYFIITAPNRLWTARNFLHLFRKITFLVGAQHSFCMNYFISLQNPEISPQNVYTAIELATLKVAYANKGTAELAQINREWITKYLPNAKLCKNLVSGNDKKATVTKIIEFLINKTGGEKIEALFYKATMKRWAKKWSNMDYDVEKCMLSAGMHFNTPINYPEHMPDKILQNYETIRNEVIDKYNNIINALTPTIAVNGCA